MTGRDRASRRLRPRSAAARCRSEGAGLLIVFIPSALWPVKVPPVRGRWSRRRFVAGCGVAQLPSPAAAALLPDQGQTAEGDCGHAQV